MGDADEELESVVRRRAAAFRNAQTAVRPLVLEVPPTPSRPHLQPDQVPVPQHLQKASRGRVRSFPPGEGDNLAEEDSATFEPRWRPCRLVHRREHCKAEEQDGTTRAIEEAGAR